MYQVPWGRNVCCNGFRRYKSSYYPNFCTEWIIICTSVYRDVPYQSWECEKHFTSCLDVAAFLIHMHITMINTSTIGQMMQLPKCKKQHMQQKKTCNKIVDVLPLLANSSQRQLQPHCKISICMVKCLTHKMIFNTDCTKMGKIMTNLSCQPLVNNSASYFWEIP